MQAGDRHEAGEPAVVDALGDDVENRRAGNEQERQRGQREQAE
jgi:hypothetical protein